LIYSTDTEVVIDACWALSYISDGSDQNIQAVLDSGVARKIVEYLGHSNHAVQTPALRTAGNIITGNDQQTQYMLDMGVLGCLFHLLQSPRKGLRKESCWTISNITAGNAAQSQLVINANIVPQLVRLMSTGEFEVKKEAAWALSNASTWKNTEQVRYLVQSGCIKPLCELLTAKDTKLITVVLEALENILIVGERLNKGSNGNPFLQPIEESEGIDKLEELQSHENEDIYKKSVKLLETYFSASEDENLAPTQNQNGFSFDAVQAPLGGFAF
jgi:importin subunit alpha-1